MATQVTSVFGAFYAHALEANEQGNNRGRVQARPRVHGRSFQPPGGPERARACSLLGRQHRGEVALWWWVSSEGLCHWQMFCQGCVPAGWRPAGPGDQIGRRPRGWRAPKVEQLDDAAAFEEV